MKIFTLKYEKNTARKSMQRMQEAAKGARHIKKDEMVCDSYETMNKLLSTARLDIFVAIVENRPESLYELAQLLHKDQSQVLKDAKMLESIGVIKLVSVMDGNREKTRPDPLYDKIVFEVAPKKIAKSA